MFSILENFEFVIFINRLKFTKKYLCKTFIFFSSISRKFPSVLSALCSLGQREHRDINNIDISRKLDLTRVSRWKVNRRSIIEEGCRQSGVRNAIPRRKGRINRLRRESSLKWRRPPTIRDKKFNRPNYLGSIPSNNSKKGSNRWIILAALLFDREASSLKWKPSRSIYG